MASIITSSKWTLYDSYSLPTRATQTKIITNEHINYRSMCNRSHLFIIDTRYLSLILVYYACTFVTSSRVHLYYIQENNDIFPVNRLRLRSDCGFFTVYNCQLTQFYFFKTHRARREKETNISITRYNRLHKLAY